MSEDEGEYTPIPCTVYSGYELAIMHRQWLRVAWQDPGDGHHVGALLPLDLQARAGAEFLIARTDDGRILRLRLDRIRSAAPL